MLPPPPRSTLFPYTTLFRSVIPKGRDRLGKLAEKIRKLPLSVAFVDVVIPAADIGEGYFYSKIGFEQLRDLAQTVAKAAAGIICSRSGGVARWVCCLEHLYSLECFLAGTVKHAVNGLRIHRFKCVTDRSCVGISSAHAEVVDVADGYGRELASKRARQRCAQSDGPERGMLLRVPGVHGAIQPSVFCGLQSRRSRFHEVLRVEMRTSFIGRASGMDNRKMSLVP